MKKNLTALVAASMLLTSTAFAAESTVDLGSAKANAKAEQGETVNVPSPVLTVMQTGDIKAAANQLVTQEIQKAKEKGPGWLQRTDINIQLAEGLKPLYSIDTIQPIGVQKDRVTTFTQFRLSNEYGEGATTNIGFGKRFLSESKKSMTGVNVFYDRAFRYGHARVGAGLEYFEGRNEYRANIYHAVSGEKSVGGNWYEKALSGYDVEAGTSFPTAPWAKVFVQGYSWDAKTTSDMNGYKIRGEIQVTPQFNLEVGYNHDNKNVSGNYLKVMYSIGKKVPAMFEHGKPVFRSNETVTVENKRLQKVHRENEILVERYQKVPNGPGGTTIKTNATFNFSGTSYTI